LKIAPSSRLTFAERGNSALEPYKPATASKNVKIADHVVTKEPPPLSSGEAADANNSQFCLAVGSSSMEDGSAPAQTVILYNAVTKTATDH